MTDLRTGLPRSEDLYVSTFFFAFSSYLRLFPALCAPESIIDSCWSWALEPRPRGSWGPGFGIKIKLSSGSDFCFLSCGGRIESLERRSDCSLTSVHGLVPGVSTRANGIRVIRRSGVVGAGSYGRLFIRFRGKIRRDDVLGGCGETPLQSSNFSGLSFPPLRWIGIIMRCWRGSLAGGLRRPGRAFIM